MVGLSYPPLCAMGFLTPDRYCSLFVLMRQEDEQDGQIHTLGLLERLRDDLSAFGQAETTLYFRLDRLLCELANPNLHDVNLASAFRIELWDRHGKDHLRIVIAAASSVGIAQAAFEAAVLQYPKERLTLRKGTMLLRDSER